MSNVSLRLDSLLTVYTITYPANHAHAFVAAPAELARDSLVGRYSTQNQDCVTCNT